MEGSWQMPVQRLLRSQKDTQWGEDCVNAVISSSIGSSTYRRSSEHNKRRNYRLFNNKIDVKDFEYVTNPFNLNVAPGEMAFSATLQPYDVLSPIFNLLLGEEAKRLFNPIVRAINEDATSAREKIKGEMILQALNQMLAERVNPEAQVEGEAPQTPEQVEKYMSYEYQELREKVANDLMQYYRKFLDLPNTFQEGWKDALIGGEEFYRIDIVGGEPRMQRVNPLNLYCTLPHNCDFIDKADKICEKNRMSVSEILDEWYDQLTPEQIDDLEEVGSSQTISVGDMVIPVVESIYSLYDDTGGSRGIDVWRVKWKSMQKFGILHYLDPSTGEEQEMEVDEDYKIDKRDKTQWIEWMWRSQFWEGIKIHNDTYLNIRPCKHQFRSMMNMSDCKSGYVGTVYSATNAQSISLMDRLVPLVYLYLITWYRTELTMAANIGRIAIMDMSLLPDNWDISKWLYYASAMKIGFVNSYSESNKGVRQGQMNQSNQNRELNLDTGDAIQRYIDILSKIEEKIYDTSGVTKQRIGEIKASEGVGNVERAVLQSASVTEEMFRVHNNTKVRALTCLVEVAKEAYMGMKKKMQYVTDDLATIFFTFDGDEFSDADYGVFISDSTRDNEALTAMKQLLQAALQNDKINLSQVLDIYTTDSIAATKNKLRQSEAQMQQQAQQGEQVNQQLQQEAMDREDARNAANNETKIQVATISAMGFAEDKDVDDDETPDVIELMQHALKEKQLQLEERKLSSQNVQDNRAQNIQEKKLKLDDENKKAKLKVDEKKVQVQRMQKKKAPSKK